MRLRKYLYICSVEMQLEVNSQNGLGATMESLTVGQAVACLFGMDSRGGETRRDAVCARNIALFRQVTKYCIAFSFWASVYPIGWVDALFCIRETPNGTRLDLARLKWQRGLLRCDLRFGSLPICGRFINMNRILDEA